MHNVSVTVLSSGSCGNSTLISDGESLLMIDAGLSCRELERRMALYGLEASDVAAILLTHEHTDHTRGAKRFSSTNKVPVHGTDGTLALTPLDGTKISSISSMKAFEVAGFTVTPFPVKHYAAEPVAFSVSTGKHKISVVSDLGCVTRKVLDAVRSSDLLFIEANYDDDMLRSGSYPDFLKRTIRSEHGHLSNADSAALCAEIADNGMRSIVLVHLSKENNTPDLARDTVSEALKGKGREVKVQVVEHGCSKDPVHL